MQWIQKLKTSINKWWRRFSARNTLHFVVVAVLALIVGITAGTYFTLEEDLIEQQTPQVVSYGPSEQELIAIVREQVDVVLAESYPWVLESSALPVAVEPLPIERPAPTEERPDYKEQDVSFEHLIWPVKGTVTTGYGWYRHPLYQDWRFNAGLELSAEDEGVRTVLPGRVTSVSSDGSETEVVIEHGGGWTSTYRSIEGLAVVPGQEVSQNESIAVAGPQGTVFFALSHEGEPVNPQAFLR